MARVSIEDCQKVMPNRFALVVVAANRARQLMGSSIPLVNTKNKQGVTALREIAEGIYPDKAHFIYELLQNAEDAQATEVFFRLQEDKLFFTHNATNF